MNYSCVDYLSDMHRDRLRLAIVKKQSFAKRQLDALQAWSLLALVGLVVGLSASLVDLLLSSLNALRAESQLSYWIYSLLFAVVAAACVRLAPNSFNGRLEYHAQASGIPQVKAIMGGFVIHGCLGFKVLIAKLTALPFAAASGLQLGILGPLVHIACCIGNVLCRWFPKYRYNQGKKREMLVASCAAGVSVAFGAPIGAVLFTLEDLDYYFNLKTMWRTFFCALVAALTVKLVNPLGAGKLVLFEVRVDHDSLPIEFIPFVIIGAIGVLFCNVGYLWRGIHQDCRLVFCIQIQTTQNSPRTPCSIYLPAHHLDLHS